MPHKRFDQRPREEQAQRVFNMYQNMLRRSIRGHHPDAPGSIEEADVWALRRTRIDYPDYEPKGESAPPARRSPGPLGTGSSMLLGRKQHSGLQCSDWYSENVGSVPI